MDSDHPQELTKHLVAVTAISRLRSQLIPAPIVLMRQVQSLADRVDRI